MADRDQGNVQEPRNREPEPQPEPAVPNPHPSRNTPTHPDEFTEGQEPRDLWKDS